MRSCDKEDNRTGLKFACCMFLSSAGVLGRKPVVQVTAGYVSNSYLGIPIAAAPVVYKHRMAPTKTN
jgi:hypothetical protein